MNKRNEQGFTLIELVVSMVVISIAMTGVLMVMNFTTRNSGNPIVRQQALMIAEAYMEEITLKPFLDPQTWDPCPAPESERRLYDNVCDYAGVFDQGAKDPDGNDIEGLGHYNVRVNIENAEIGPEGKSIGGLRIGVNVSGPGNEVIYLVMERAGY